MRTRIASVTNTRKITEAMRLVAAAKVRRAQPAVLATRPFSETLQSVFGGLIERLGSEDVDLPLLEQRDVGKVTLVLMSGDRGLCGGYNSYGIKKTEARIKELKDQDVEVDLVTVGKKPLACKLHQPREKRELEFTKQKKTLVSLCHPWAVISDG